MWLIHTFVMDYVYVTWLLHVCDVWQEFFMCVTCDMTPSCVWRVTWLIHVCGIMFSQWYWTAPSSWFVGPEMSDILGLVLQVHTLRMSHVTHTKKSCHVTHTNESCHTHKEVVKISIFRNLHSQVSLLLNFTTAKVSYAKFHNVHFDYIKCCRSSSWASIAYTLHFMDDMLVYMDNMLVHFDYIKCCRSSSWAMYQFLISVLLPNLTV